MDDDLKVVIKVFGGICLACVIIALLFLLYHVGFSTGHGEQIGYISEVSNSGIIWRPTQVNLINSEPTYSDSQTSYDYGVDSDKITALAKKYVKSHEKVIVTWRDEFAVPAWEYHSSTIITDIKPAGGA